MSSSNGSTSDNTNQGIPVLVNVIIWLSIGVLTCLTNMFALGIIISARRVLKGQTYIILGSSFTVCILFGIWNGFFVEFLGGLPNFDKTVSVLLCTFGTVGIVGLMTNINLHLCLISADRYVFVMYPFHYKQIVNKTYVSLALLLIWLLPTASVLSLVTYRNISLQQCTYMVQNDNATLVSDAISLNVILTILFFLPLFMVIIVYTRIFFVIKSHTKALYAGRDHVAVGSKVSKSFKAVVQMSILIGVFAVMFLPMTLLTISVSWKSFIPSLPITFVSVQNAIIICRYIAYSYPCLHPILYCYFNAQIKLEIWRRFYSCIGKKEKFRRRLQTNNGTIFK